MVECGDGAAGLSGRRELDMGPCYLAWLESLVELGPHQRNAGRGAGSDKRRRPEDAYPKGCLKTLDPSDGILVGVVGALGQTVHGVENAHPFETEEVDIISREAEFPLKGGPGLACFAYKVWEEGRVSPFRIPQAFVVFEA